MPSTARAEASACDALARLVDDGTLPSTRVALFARARQIDDAATEECRAAARAGEVPSLIARLVLRSTPPDAEGPTAGSASWFGLAQAAEAATYALCALGPPSEIERMERAQAGGEPEASRCLLAVEALGAAEPAARRFVDAWVRERVIAGTPGRPYLTEPGLAVAKAAPPTLRARLGDLLARADALHVDGRDGLRAAICARPPPVEPQSPLGRACAASPARAEPAWAQAQQAAWAAERRAGDRRRLGFTLLATALELATAAALVGAAYASRNDDAGGITLGTIGGAGAGAAAGLGAAITISWPMYRADYQAPVRVLACAVGAVVGAIAGGILGGLLATTPGDRRFALSATTISIGFSSALVLTWANQRDVLLME